MKNNRTLSFIIITIVYLLATVCGILVYKWLPLDTLWLKLLIADVSATVLTYIFSVIFSNASVYDPYWSVQPIIIVIAFLIGKELNLARVLILLAVCFWGVRLTANWAYTFHGLNHQDWRYTMLREKTGKLYPIVNFLGIHMFPTIVVYACVLPAVYVIEYNVTPNALSFVFISVSFLAVILQGAADIQMHKFRKNRTSKFIRCGLWKYSRHPNYLGEILMWWGVALFLVTSNLALWYFAAGALVNTLMFLFISIPMADKRQSKKEGFSEYKMATRMLFPIKK